MSKPSRRKLEKKKRKAKERAKRSRQPTLSPYYGNKYVTEELGPWLFNTSVAIVATNVTQGRRLTDQQVARGVESLIQTLRKGPLPEFEIPGHLPPEAPDDEEQLVMWGIRQGWLEVSSHRSRPPRDQLVGILRTILGMIEDRTGGPGSQAFLQSMEQSLEEYRAEEAEDVLPSFRELEPKQSPPEEQGADEQAGPNDLLRLGQQWRRLPNSQLGKPFRELAAELIRSGLGPEVAQICQELLKETTTLPPHLRIEFKAMAILGERAGAGNGPPQK